MNSLGLKRSTVRYCISGRHVILVTRIRYILNEIQTGYGIKAFNAIKAIVTCWFSHGAAYKRTRERYPIIVT